MGKMQPLAKTKASMDRTLEFLQEHLLPAGHTVPRDGVGNKRRFRALLHSRPLTSATALEALNEARRM